jgi:hypothetical protein
VNAAPSFPKGETEAILIPDFRVCQAGFGAVVEVMDAWFEQDGVVRAQALCFQRDFIIRKLGAIFAKHGVSIALAAPTTVSSPSTRRETSADEAKRREGASLDFAGWVTGPRRVRDMVGELRSPSRDFADRARTY